MSIIVEPPDFAPLLSSTSRLAEPTPLLKGEDVTDMYIIVEVSDSAPLSSASSPA